MPNHSEREEGKQKIQKILSIIRESTKSTIEFGVE